MGSKAKVKGTGLFNATKGATIKKLGVESALITGIDQNVGGIIGQMPTAFRFLRKVS